MGPHEPSSQQEHPSKEGWLVQLSWSQDGCAEGKEEHLEVWTWGGSDLPGFTPGLHLARQTWLGQGSRMMREVCGTAGFSRSQDQEVPWLQLWKPLWKPRAAVLAHGMPSASASVIFVHGPTSGATSLCLLRSLPGGNKGVHLCSS